MKLQKVIDAHGNWYKDACGTAFAMELIGERWTLLIVRELMLGGRRFSDIRANLPGISAKVLTERLERLERVGILTRRKLAPPAAAQVYELTGWGYALESVMQALGRWAVQSPMHDPSLPLSPVSFMLSLRTMLDPDRARGLAATVRIEAGDAHFLAFLKDGEMPVRRAESPASESPPPETPVDVTFRAPSASHFLPVFYGKRPADACGVEVIGDEAVARRFVDAFALPPRLAPSASGSD